MPRENIRNLFTLYEINYGILASDNKTVVTTSHEDNEACVFGIMDAVDTDSGRMIYQNVGAKLKKIGVFNEDSMVFTPDFTHNWHIAPICITCREEKFHNAECSERQVSRMVTGGGLAGGMKVSSKKPLLSPRSSRRCLHGRIQNHRFPFQS